MSGPTIFLSYSHKDEAWKDLVVGQLRVLELEGAFELWDDRKIAAGNGWHEEIGKAIDRARAAVLLISADFLTSGFIRGTEIPRLLARRARRAEGGLRIIPLIVRPCPWRRVPWLAEIEGRPKDGRPLAAGTSVQVEEDLSALAEEIADLLQVPGSAPLAPPQTPRGSGPVPILDLGRLPVPGPQFVGREPDLARLDAVWVDPAVHVLTLVAFGGVGKSALVARWLDRMAADGWRGAARVLDWSFYSQGMENRITSAEPFIDYALQFFGDPDPKAGSLHDRGARLAYLVPVQKRAIFPALYSALKTRHGERGPFWPCRGRHPAEVTRKDREMRPFGAGEAHSAAASGSPRGQRDATFSSADAEPVPGD
jgi:hypothetical protein